MKKKIAVLNIHGDTTFEEGTTVVIPGYEQHSFLFCKNKYMKGYIIREFSTGLSVYPFWEWCRNKEQSIDTAKRYLDLYHDSGRYDTQRYLDDHNNGKPINETINKPKIKQRSLFEN